MSKTNVISGVCFALLAACGVAPLGKGLGKQYAPLRLSAAFIAAFDMPEFFFASLFRFGFFLAKIGFPHSLTWRFWFFAGTSASKETADRSQQIHASMPPTLR
jgi:hypothetical protein